MGGIGSGRKPYRSGDGATMECMRCGKKYPYSPLSSVKLSCPECVKAVREEWLAKTRDERSRRCKDYRKRNKDAIKGYTEARAKTHYWVDKAKNIAWRAKKNGIQFDISVQDIEACGDVCPVLGARFTRGSKTDKEYNPSVDRIDPSQGYVRDNIRVISFRANSIKRDATPDEILSVALYAYTATGHTLPDIHAKVNEIAQRQVEYAKINAGTETVGDYAQPDLTQPEAKPHVPAETSDTRVATAVIPMKNSPGAIEANEFLAASSHEGSKFNATTETLGTGSSVCSVHNNPWYNATVSPQDVPGDSPAASRLI